MNLARMALCTHVEIVYALGHREVVTIDAYREMDDLPLASLARPPTRREVLARRNRKPRRAS